MTRLSDTQLVILSAAAQRDDLSVLPLPDSPNLKGGALNRVMDSLRNRSLIRVLGGDAPAPATEANGAARPARGKGKGKAKATKAAPLTSEPEAAGEPTAKPTPRAGTKQALMTEQLKRPEGATVEQIAAATGWQHHTIRGDISGALKKKLGLTVEATRTREVGPNKVGAKGSSTIYRIVG